MKSGLRKKILYVKYLYIKISPAKYEWHSKEARFHVYWMGIAQLPQHAGKVTVQYGYGVLEQS